MTATVCTFAAHGAPKAAPPRSDLSPAGGQIAFWKLAERAEAAANAHHCICAAGVTDEQVFGASEDAYLASRQALALEIDAILGGGAAEMIARVLA